MSKNKRRNTVDDIPLRPVSPSIIVAEILEDEALTETPLCDTDWEEPEEKPKPKPIVPVDYGPNAPLITRLDEKRKLRELLAQAMKNTGGKR